MDKVDHYIKELVNVIKITNEVNLSFVKEHVDIQKLQKVKAKEITTCNAKIRKIVKIEDVDEEQVVVNVSLRVNDEVDDRVLIVTFLENYDKAEDKPSIDDVLEKRDEVLKKEAAFTFTNNIMVNDVPYVLLLTKAVLFL